MSEFWDAYDAEGKLLKNKLLVRGEPVPKGLFHIISSIIVKHKDGTYLLMQRVPEKTHGGKWELSAGGAVLKGENATQGAIRELQEETGIYCPSLLKLDQVAKEAFRGIFAHFLCITDIDKGSIKLQQGETNAFKWVTQEELKAIPDYELMSTVERDMVFNLKL